jgi:hypothetical protein
MPTQDAADLEGSDDDTTSESGSHEYAVHGQLVGVQQVIPLLLSTSAEDIDCYSVYAAQHAIPRRVLIKRHPYDMAFAITDFKLQGRTIPKLILSLPKRHELPWMSLQSFYVLISRVPCMDGLRLLQYDRKGLQSVRTQMPDIYLYAWERGFDNNGLWNEELAVKALRHIRHERQLDKAAYSASTREQSFTDNQRSPCKKRPSETSSPQRKRQSLYRCAACTTPGHNTQQCDTRVTQATRQPLYRCSTCANPGPNTQECDTTVTQVQRTLFVADIASCQNPNTSVQSTTPIQHF